MGPPIGQPYLISHTKAQNMINLNTKKRHCGRVATSLDEFLRGHSLYPLQAFVEMTHLGDPKSRSKLLPGGINTCTSAHHDYVY